MSIYTDSNNNINRYFLEIEKYIPQLQNNPYISELEEDIITQKKRLILILIIGHQQRIFSQ